MTTDTNDSLIKHLEYAASLYSADAMLWLSLTNPGRELELRATSEKLVIHFMFPNLPDDVRAELTHLVFEAYPLCRAKHKLESNPDDQATKTEAGILEAELSEKVKELMDQCGHVITDMQRALLARKLGLKEIAF